MTTAATGKPLVSSGFQAAIAKNGKKRDLLIMTENLQPSTKPALAMIKGGKLTAQEFSSLPFPQKVDRIREMPSRKRLDLLTEDPDGKQLTKAFAPQEFYLMMKEIGETDAISLLTNCSPEQLAFCLDLELWEKWDFRFDQACTWLGYILSIGEEHLWAHLRRLDWELIQLILINGIEVGGGVGELSTDAERLGDWDHSIDNLYFITFRDSKHARLLGSLIDILYRYDHQLYMDLMEGCRSSIKSELEDLCYQFKSGRLADLGFPDYDQAIEIYLPIPPEAFALSDGKSSITADVYATVLLSSPDNGGGSDTLLSRILQSNSSVALQQELGYLFNCALIAENGTMPDDDTIRIISNRVYGWLNIALEHLAGNNEVKGREIIYKEYIKRLFRLGCGIIQDVVRLAKTVQSDNYATSKALRGFTAQRPRFYRGLDSDHADGYREFQTIDDVRRAKEFLVAAIAASTTNSLP